jgi:20S proteasome subunit beta 2
MMSEQVLPNRGGFDFSYCQRNAFLEKNGVKMPTTKKTGTTIAGVVYKDGIVLGADTRATEGPIVADKNCEKIHYIAPNIYCCGAGTSADTENTTALISSKLALHRLATGRPSRVVTALTMLKQMLFRYQGYVSAALVLGGVDVHGPHLHTVWPHGSTDTLPYVTMGSGSLAAMAVFEEKFKKDMNKDEAVALVHDAICSGIFNDLGSGGNVDIVVITKEGVQILRNYDKPNPRKYRRGKPYAFELGTTPILAQAQTPLSEKIIVTTEVGDAMEF